MTTIYGKISHWNEGRGFGIVQSDSDRATTLLHVYTLRACGYDAEMLDPGTAVRCECELGESGRLRATAVEIL